MNHIPKRDLSTPYERVMQTMERYSESAAVQRSYAEAYGICQRFQTEILDALAGLSAAAHRNGPSTARSENRLHAAAVRLLSRESAGIGTEVPLSPEELLAMAANTVAEILLSGADPLDFSIFESSAGNNGGYPESLGDGVSFEERTERNDQFHSMDVPMPVPKMAAFFEILESRGINLSVLRIRTEAVGSGWRKLPYSIVYVPEAEATVVISDEVGEKTYVFRGDVSPDSLRSAQKGKDIGHSAPVGVVYGKDYPKRLESALFGEAAKRAHEIYRYRNLVMRSRSDLIATGMEITPDGWDFSAFASYRHWPKIDGKHLRSFPSRAFNIAFGIGDKDGVMYKPEEIENLFRTLGIPVREITREQEFERYRSILLSHSDAIAKMGIDFRNGAYHFSDMVGYRDYPDIDGKHFGSFPGGTFCKKYGIGTEKGLLRNVDHVRSLFVLLGLPVASETQEYARWRELILEKREELASIGVRLEEGGWDIAGVRRTVFWPRIGNRSLTTFPNGRFNRERGIGTKNGMLTGRQHLRDMFAAIGFAVISSESTHS